VGEPLPIPDSNFDKRSDALKLFQAALPPEFFRQRRRAVGLPPEEKGVYTTSVVMMLMILQRVLPGRNTLSETVQHLQSGWIDDLLSEDKRITEGTLSDNAGAFCRARCRLSKGTVEMGADRVTEYLLAEHKEAMPGLGRQAFLLDGTVIDLPHTPSLVKAYPPASNQHGAAHWPMMRVLVAHDLVSGIAVRPAFGPMYGSQAVSEQSLAAQAIDRLPDGSIIVWDRNFGVFWVSCYAHQKKHPFVARLTDVRARSLYGGKLPSQVDQWIDWKPSRWDRSAHPDLPADACIRVRLIATQVKRKGKIIQLYLVTTLDLPVEQIVELYGFRWNIELDLRSLKHTVPLHSLSSTPPEMAEKELILGVTAYNFVRAAIWAAARLTNVDPRRISFSRAQAVVNGRMPILQAARSEAEYAVELERMLRRIAKCLLPQSHHRESCPRKVWPRRGSKFPKQKPATRRRE